MSWLSSVNWENIGKGASTIGAAAVAITDAANSIKQSKLKKNVTTTQSGDGGIGAIILPLLALFIFKS